MGIVASLFHIVLQGRRNGCFRMVGSLHFNGSRTRYVEERWRIDWVSMEEGGIVGLAKSNRKSEKKRGAGKVGVGPDAPRAGHAGGKT
jgi:hypothetical protein